MRVRGIDFSSGSRLSPLHGRCWLKKFSVKFSDNKRVFVASEEFTIKISALMLKEMEGISKHVLGLADNLPLPLFDKLIHLTLSIGVIVVDRSLISFLQQTPVLQSLILADGISGVDKDALVDEVVPPCIRSNLKVAEFGNFSGKGSPVCTNGLEALNGECLVMVITRYAETGVFEEKFLVIMADEKLPTFLAAPIFPKGSCISSIDGKRESEETEKVENDEKNTEE
ncbi:hypothetical protein RJ641_000345 [Dillenia turbinata]|uniref:Uncharacterized protein n=1 Tax=Dillenia turbinata TaxID=194707 RepID=A0AAN8WIT2_9MAGN